MYEGLLTYSGWSACQLALVFIGANGSHWSPFLVSELSRGWACVFDEGDGSAGAPPPASLLCGKTREGRGCWPNHGRHGHGWHGRMCNSDFFWLQLSYLSSSWGSVIFQR